MMNKVILEYGGNDYPIEETTIREWITLSSGKEFLDDNDFKIFLISTKTGLTPEQIRTINKDQIDQAVLVISEYMTNESKKYHDRFTFKGKQYKMIDLRKLSFGEFIDIDDYLGLPELTRQQRVNYFMSLMYRELDEKGNYMVYDTNRILKTSEDFMDLPVKYLDGALRFFLTIDELLHENTRYYFYQMKWWILRMLTMKKRVKELVGIQ